MIPDNGYTEYYICDDNQLNAINDKKLSCAKCKKNILVKDNIVKKYLKPDLTKIISENNLANYMLSNYELYHKKCFSIYIPKHKIPFGITNSNNYAQYLCIEARSLHNLEKYQISIPCAILSFEESSKMDSLIELLEVGIMEPEWKKLESHHIKTHGLENNIIKFLNSLPDNHEFFNGYKKFLEQGINNVATTKDEALQLKITMQSIQSKFSKIKEYCFYSNWDKRHSKWINFQDIPHDDQQLISTVVNFIALEKLLITEHIWEGFNDKIHDGTSSIDKLRIFEYQHISFEELEKGKKVIYKYFSN